MGRRRRGHVRCNKEEAHDGDISDPDLMPLQIDEAWIERLRSALPQRPRATASSACLA